MPASPEQAQEVHAYVRKVLGEDPGYVLRYARDRIEVGSDIGGSIRVPAMFCGVYGHKTSYNLAPMGGHDAGVDADNLVLKAARELASAATRRRFCGSGVMPR